MPTRYSCSIISRGTPIFIAPPRGNAPSKPPQGSRSEREKSNLRCATCAARTRFDKPSGRRVQCAAIARRRTDVGASFTTVGWHQGRVRLIDQRQLPDKVVYLDCADYRDVAEAIRNLSVRGAPAIGITAAMGLALGAQSLAGRDPSRFQEDLTRIADELAATRPTAVNLFWALDRMKRVASSHRHLGVDVLIRQLVDESQAILDEDIAMNRAMGAIGATFIESGDTVLTHCNAGALATGGYGTALGVIRAAWEDGKKIRVIADETRPVLQGARLTAWELMQDAIPVTLITDNMAGALMRAGKIQRCIVGADRIAANGDVANKIGTYSVAVLAHHHAIPFYVAAPTSTLDLSIPSGAHIPIEARNPREVTHIRDVAHVAPEGVAVDNPAFDVTPADLITAIITEKGAFRPRDIHRLGGDPASLTAYRLA
ncbi:MAG: S-methyl-5-thioribose-1-phosphate isomerase [Nitrospirae bacterium]|nr:S-methyl-5-thioribose-1-phosphate isomerase [Nitrospirota bacterium]